MDNVNILLTATVNPNGMAFTELQDPLIRKQQYVEAAEYYLSHTSANIIVCENSGNNFYDEIESIEKTSRLEFICINTNDEGRLRGKSYTEAQILKYALENSKFLQSQPFFIKITGRVKILNIKEIIDSLKYPSKDVDVLQTEILDRNFVKSVCFIASKKWMLETVNNYLERLDERESCHFEWMLYDSALYSKNLKISSIFPIIDGICGSLNKKYVNITPPSEHRLNHYNSLYTLYKLKSENWNYIKAKAKWYFYILKRKWDVARKK